MTIESTRSTATGSLLSKITFSSHVGTHLDAPKHAVDGGIGIDELALDKFIGACRVIDLAECETSIKPDDIKRKEIKRGEKILFKTKNSNRGLDKFYSDFVFVSSDAAHYLADIGVGLVGIDYFSIKQKGSADNTPHTALLSKNIPILEGINLSEVKEGKYFLIALPLKFTDLDGSPTRAVLLED